MFCVKCGEKLKEDDKFCPKCSHAVAADKTDKDDKDKKPPIPGVAKPATASCGQSCAGIFLVLLLIVFLVALFSSYSQIKSTPNLKYGFILFGLCLVLLWGWAFMGRHKNPVQKLHAKPKNTCLAIVTIIAIIAIPVVVIVFYTGDVFQKSLTDATKNPTPEKTSTTTPAKTTKTETNKPVDDTPTPASWDGNYDAQMVKPNCDSSVEITSFQVSGGQVVNLWGSDAAIGSDNQATLTYDTGATMTVNFAFSMSAGQAAASGTWSTSRGCSGTFQATRS
jgi:hypothetical protein